MGVGNWYKNRQGLPSLARKQKKKHPPTHAFTHTSTLKYTHRAYPKSMSSPTSGRSTCTTSPRASAAWSEMPMVAMSPSSWDRGEGADTVWLEYAIRGVSDSRCFGRGWHWCGSARPTRVILAVAIGAGGRGNGGRRQEPYGGVAPCGGPPPLCTT